MPRHFGDTGFNKSELPATEEIFNRKSRRSEKLTEHRHRHHNLTGGHSCMKCELPRYEVEPQERRRRKQKNQPQHCPSCHCKPEITRHFLERGPKEKHTESMEAMLENYESYLVDPQNSSMKRSKSPFSLPTELRSRPTGDIHGSKRGPNSGQYQSSRNECSEELHTMLMDMINSGLADENTEICDKNTCRKDHYKNEDQLPCNHEESELDSDSSKKTFTDHCQSKKDKVGCFERTRESIEKCGKEKDEELKQTKRDCEELNQLTLEVKEYQKMKGMRQNLHEKKEQGQIKCRKEGDNQKKKPKFLNKYPTSRYDELPLGSNTSGKTRAHQRHKIEASTSYHSLPKDDKDFDNDVEVDFSNQLQLQQELKGNPCSTVPHLSVIQNSQIEKSEENNMEILSFANENEFKNKEAEFNEGRKNLYGGGDLDLHVCKSYIVDLIDRALSKQLGTQPGDKKGDVTKNSPSWQEMCIEVTRALQGDYGLSFAQNLYNFQENMDNVKLLKSFRWGYVKHIQEELRSLEKIIDICSPRLAKKESAAS